MCLTKDTQRFSVMVNIVEVLVHSCDVFTNNTTNGASDWRSNLQLQAHRHITTHCLRSTHMYLHAFPCFCIKETHDVKVFECISETILGAILTLF